MSCHVMSCHVMSCHVMSCHVMSCHVMSCHVMSCHVMSVSHSFSSFIQARAARARTVERESHHTWCTQKRLFSSSDTRTALSTLLGTCFRLVVFLVTSLRVPRALYVCFLLCLDVFPCHRWWWLRGRREGGREGAAVRSGTSYCTHGHGVRLLPFRLLDTTSDPDALTVRVEKREDFIGDAILILVSGSCGCGLACLDTGFLHGFPNLCCRGRDRIVTVKRPSGMKNECPHGYWWNGTDTLGLSRRVNRISCLLHRVARETVSLVVLTIDADEVLVILIFETLPCSWRC